MDVVCEPLLFVVVVALVVLAVAVVFLVSWTVLLTTLTLGSAADTKAGRPQKPVERRVRESKTQET